MVAVAVAVAAIIILAIVTCFQKDKKVFGGLGIAGLRLPAFAWMTVFAIVGVVAGEVRIRQEVMRPTPDG